MNTIQKIIADNSITNFTESEILNGYPEKNIPVNLIPNIAPTLKLLQMIRTDIGKPIIIHSTYRDKHHNTEVKGKTNSLHLSFNAIDFAPVETSFSQLEAIYHSFLRGKYTFDFSFHGKPFKENNLIGGVGLYNTFIHIDTRGLLGRLSPAVWRG